jgi:Na+-driven multidrug efflux pump
MFQGTGNGSKALIATVFRSIITTLPVAYILGVVLEWGLVGIWSGIVIGNVIGSVAIYVWSRHYIHSLNLVPTKGESCCTPEPS